MIRTYRTDDADALVPIWRKANALAPAFLPQEFVAQVAQDMRKIYLPNAETWVLEDDGTPVGFIALIDDEIGGLFLDPSFHGKGLGKTMVDQAVGLRGLCASRFSRKTQSVAASTTAMASSKPGDTHTNLQTK